MHGIYVCTCLWVPRSLAILYCNCKCSIHIFHIKDILSNKYVSNYFKSINKSEKIVVWGVFVEVWDGLGCFGVVWGVLG